MTEETLDKAWIEWEENRSSTAADVLVESYMSLVHYHVHRIGVGLPKNVDKEELISHGLIGLYDALEKFDRSRDLKFDTYASFRVRGAIIDGLRREDWLPRSVRDKAKKIDDVTERLEQEKGRLITAEEIAEELEMNTEEVIKVNADSFVSNMLSIDEETADSEREESYRNTIEDPNTPTPEQQLDRDALKEDLRSVIEKLNDREQLVISLFYDEGLTLTEIGEVLELSTSRISQIHSKALYKMRQVLAPRFNER
ncbi:FliA/WhiG family RNA polymerase sigma factor [Salsuginibacillus kocurii]|uniref:FliA/WhiG family RNA polymerase sigma factor n=1 Tax=Salsuginibacillus kocurii TaxID=427078 RepID=UPI000478331A|nr:FliA/WhiG family RNA polymerase sigma factor [Salsuginibacillus kocurii]